MGTYVIKSTPSGTSLTTETGTFSVGRAVIDAQAGNFPQVTVWTDAEIHGEGVIRVVGDPTAEELSEAVASLLLRLDPDKVARLAGQLADQSGEGGVGPVLRAAAQMIQEAAL